MKRTCETVCSNAHACIAHDRAYDGDVSSSDIVLPRRRDGYQRRLVGSGFYAT